VFEAASVFSLSAASNCRVVVGKGVVRGVITKERLGTHGGVIKGINIEPSANAPTGRVVVGDVVKFKRGSSNGRVFSASRVEQSVAVPTAVFESAVLRSNAPAPTAVLKLAVVVLNKRVRAKCCVGSTSGKTLKRVLPFRVVKLG